MLVSPTPTRLDALHPALLLQTPKVKHPRNSTYSVHSCQSRYALQASTTFNLQLGGQHATASQRCHGTTPGGFSTISLTPDVEDVVRKAATMNFFQRLHWAWNILFPKKPKKISNADIAKKRLKMILFSDRCEITDEAKQKIINNIVGALSDFVEIESEENVQLDVSADPDLGTVYSVSVPVRRVKPDYQEYSSAYGDQEISDDRKFVDPSESLSIKSELSTRRDESI
eukprot:TRINITY_DN5449_c0_g1_i1.p1 TRINITY_DN5449_c0_g1~~TRINITY_DN5449_c0_g1_i1.p1  ORF type:complete len:228 (-),score=31.84 TRINITY_DN5449_c0_g1_i1:272-955(-)